MSYDGIDSVVGKRGLFMWRIASRFFLQRLKRSMSRDARDFNNMETRAVIKFFFPMQGKAPKEIHAILKETWGVHALSYATIKNWVSQFKRGDFSTFDAPRPGRPKTMTTPEIIDQSHELILEDRQISAISIAVQLGISRERVGSTIHEDLDMRKLSAKWVPKCLNADRKRQRCQSSEKILDFFGSIQMISCREWWPWSIPGYITMTRSKAKIKGVAAKRLISPPKIPSAKIRWKSSRLDFLGSRRHTPHWLSSKWPNYQHGVLLISAGAIEGHFDGKTPAAGRSPRGSCSCTTMPRLTGHLHPRRNRPTWPSNVLIAHPILRIWPRRTTTCSLDWRKQLKFRHFSSDAEVIAATETWLDGQILIFLSGLQKLEQRAKKCIEIRGVCVEQIPSLVAVACFRSWSG